MRHPALGSILAMLLLSPAPPAGACTTFCLKHAGKVIFGRNYDFMIGDGLVLVNKRDVAKTSAVTGDLAASWISRYGSVTFNQFGREFPTGGINEKGLVVELMWLDGTRYPGPDARGSVGVLEWIQYQLDQRADVADLLAHAEDVRIHGASPLHYLVADRSGAAAVIEFLDGRLVTHSGPTLPVAVLANDVYEESVARWRGSAQDRFGRAAAMVRDYEESPRGSIVDYGFDVLAAVAQQGATRWSIVYDLPALTVHFRTSTHPAIRSFTLTSFDYSCGTTVRMLDVNAPLSGDVAARFVDYTHQANLALVAGSYAGVPFLSGTTREEVESAARHGEATKCLERRQVAR